MARPTPLRIALLFVFWSGATLDSSAAVTDLGTYQTSIAIQVPRFHTIAPAVQLVYDSSTGNGPLGLGWSLQAGSQITRSSEQGGVPRYDATDQLWLDGLELLPCAVAPQSVSCSTGGTHTTRIETFTRIALQPDNTWIVWRRDGTRSLYQPRFRDTTSPVDTLLWVMTEVMDTHGNRVSYESVCGAGFVCYLSDITYGGGTACQARPGPGPEGTIVPAGSALPGVRIHFFWEGRPDPPTFAIGGVMQELNWRLRAIDVQEGGERVRVYQINYLAELSGVLGYTHRRSWIQSIQLFGSDAAVDSSGTVTSGTALPANRFDAAVFQRAPDPSFANTFSGNDDFVPAGPSQPGLPRMYPVRAVQRFPPSRVVIRTYRRDLPWAVELSNRSSATFGDFDGDRKLDFMHWNTDGGCTLLQTRTVMGSWPAGRAPVDEQHTLVQANLCMTTTFPADLDGDGRTDVLFLRYRREEPFNRANLKYQAEAIPLLSNGDGTFTFRTPTILWTSPNERTILQSRCATGDFDGDGRSDITCTLKDRGRWLVRQGASQGAGRFRMATDNQPNTLTDRHMLAVADANGDGLADLIVVDETGPSNAPLLHIKVAVSLGFPFLWRIQTTTVPAAGQQRARVLPGDFNGDGRADFTVVVDNGNGTGSLTTFASSAGTSHTYRISTAVVSGNMPVTSVGDINGDRLDDLVFGVRHRAGTCGSTSSVDTQGLAVSFSDGTGTFQVPSNFNTCYADTGLPWIGDWTHDATAASVNGDFISDLFQYYEGASEVRPNVWQPAFLLEDRTSGHALADLWRWQPTEINGDGVPDWLYVNYGNPGLIVVSVITQPDGTRRRFRADIPSENPTRPELARVDVLSTVLMADVGGGPSSAPDGKIDIVVADDATQQLVTLLANGDGTWRKRVVDYAFTPFSTLRGRASTAAEGTVNGWRALDVNGDGRADLVHLSFRDSGTGLATPIRATTIRSLGDGTWEPPIGADLAFGNDPDVRSFYPADVNGDGLMDLVRVRADSFLPLGQNAMISTAISRGDGSWDSRNAGITLPSTATAKWTPMEVNGDGRTDLAHIRIRAGQPLLLSSVLSLGDGRWQPVADSSVSPALPFESESNNADFRITDVDGDGKQDIVRLMKTGAGQAATTVLWNRYPSLVQTTTPGLSIGTDNNAGWVVADLDADGRPELARIQRAANTNLDVIAIPAAETRMTIARNGMGASDEISYGTVRGPDRTMPLGSLPRVVTSVIARAEEGAAPAAVVTHAFSGPRYSFRQRRFLGFARVEIADGARIVAADLDLTDECGARRSTQEIMDPARRPIERTTFQFAASTVPGGPPIPVPGNRHDFSLCRAEIVRREEMERSGTARVSEGRSVYDGYGNVRELIQTGDLADPADDRRIEMLVNPNVADFILDRLAWEGVSGRVRGQWLLLAETQYEYDGSNDYRIPPRQTGDLTRVRRVADGPNRFVDTTHEYDARGNVIVTRGPSIPSNANGIEMTFTYDCDFQRFPERMCDPLHCTDVVWDRRAGHVRSTSNANGLGTVTTYDALGRVILETYPDRSFDRWTFPTLAQWGTSGQGLTREVSDGSPNDGVLRETTYFDGLSRVTRVEREGGVSREILEYDGVSERVRQETALRFAQDPPKVTTHSYDPAGRLLSTRYPDGSTGRISYGVGTQVAANEMGATTAYDIDPFGRITAVRENRRDCFTENCRVVESAVTQYAYDALNRLVRITDAGKNETNIDWDALGRRRRICDPDRGCTTFTWNDDATLATVRDANGAEHRMTYDAKARSLVRLSFNSAGRQTREVRWSWDTNPSTGAPNGASVGEITSVSDDSAAARLSSSYRYDRMGRIDRATECIDGNCFEVGTTFDSSGRISRVTYPDANGGITASSLSVDYVYGSDGSLEEVPGYIARIQHGAAGNPTAITFGNGVTEVRSYDADRGWLGTVEVQVPGGGTIFEQTVERDRAGRVREQRIRTPARRRNDVYEHDDRGRLTAVRSSDRSHNLSLRFDVLGNLTFHSAFGDVLYDDPAHVHAPSATRSGQRFRYDNLGQLLRSNNLRIQWDEEERPASIVSGRTRVAYAYDRAGIRVKTEARTGVTLRPHPHVEVDSSGRIIPSILAGGRRIARITGGAPSFLHADVLGSTRVLTDSSGTIINEHDYTATGVETPSALPGGNPFRFTGAHADPTGLLYLNARYYDPALPRFISADSIIPDLYDPQSLNRYAYALNDPVTLTDPSGHCVVDESGYGVDCTDPIRTPAVGVSGPRETFIETPDQANPSLARVRDFTYDPIAGTRGPNTLFVPNEPDPKSNAASDARFEAGMAHLSRLLGKLSDAEIQAQRAQAADPRYPQLYSAESPYLATNDVFLKQVERTGGYDVIREFLIPHLGFEALRVAAAIIRGRAVIYLRLNPTTGSLYVGQSRTWSTYMSRQLAHDLKLGIQHEFYELQRVWPGKRGIAVDVAEETWIRRGGGPMREGGGLANGRYQMTDDAYRAFGGREVKPTP